MCVFDDPCPLIPVMLAGVYRYNKTLKATSVTPVCCDAADTVLCTSHIMHLKCHTRQHAMFLFKMRPVRGAGGDHKSAVGPLGAAPAERHPIQAQLLRSGGCADNLPTRTHAEAVYPSPPLWDPPPSAPIIIFYSSTLTKDR